MAEDFLSDTLFLNALDNLHVKEQYVKITILSWDENPLREIQGKVISGNCNIQASSSMRRTASLSMFAEAIENDLTEIDTDVSINRKIKLEIGIKNTVPNYIYDTSDSNGIVTHHTVNYVNKYGSIVWFSQGIYVIFDPSISRSSSGVTISLTLKDKMCLLDGEAGGTLPAAVYFHEKEEDNEDGTVTITYPTINQIIREAVNHFGGIPLPKIIISDLEEQTKQVMQYVGGSPLYYVQSPNKIYTFNKSEAISLAGSEDNIITYSYGQDIGYIITDFIYPGELISNIGDTVVTILDNIISILGNYEYFFDIDGVFHFQEIKNYLNTTYTTTILKKAQQNKNESETYSIDLGGSMAVYDFSGTKLIDSISNAPKYSNIKNDYIVWGVRKTSDGLEIPIRYHMAIDNKPIITEIDNIECYGKHSVQLYTDENDIIRAKQSSTNTVNIYTKDWREEIYYQGIEALDTGTDYPYYYTELANEWPKLYDLENQCFKETVLSDPSSIDYYFDMIDDNAEIGKYSVNNIGRRTIIVDDDNINCIFEQDIPDIVFLNLADNDIETKRSYYESIGQEYCQIEENLYDLLAIGGVENSCYQRICEELYQYTNMNNTISISAIPIYYFDVNTRITVNDLPAGIFGDYIISSISIPFDINSTMTISAYKAQMKM